MIILSIETSTSFGGICILSDETLLASVQIDSKITHSQRLMPAIQDTLEKINLTVKDITAIAISQGPGSFTGIRIGMSVAKALAYSTHKPIIAVPTLDALAAILLCNKNMLICPILDARRDEIYSALYKYTKESLFPVRKSEYLVLPIEELLKRIKTKCMFVGNGAIKYKNEIMNIIGENAFFPGPSANVPSAIIIAELAMLRAKDKNFDNIFALEPIYVRKSDAEISKILLL